MLLLGGFGWRNSCATPRVGPTFVDCNDKVSNCGCLLCLIWCLGRSPPIAVRTVLKSVQNGLDQISSRLLRGELTWQTAQ